jgi:hypothetical protein
VFITLGTLARENGAHEAISIALMVDDAARAKLGYREEAQARQELVALGPCLPITQSKVSRGRR